MSIADDPAGKRDSSVKNKLCVFVVFVVIKFLLIAGLGSVSYPDSSGYTAYADTILSSTSWLRHIDLTKAVMEITAFRVIGYPAILALAKSISPEHFDTVIIVIQTILSLIAAYYVWELTYAFTTSRFLSALSSMIFLSSNSLYDLSILTDSIYNSLYTILLCLLATKAIKKRTYSIHQLALLGVLGAASVLVRESGLYFLVFLVPLLILQLGKTLPSTKRIVLQVMVFLTPAILVVMLYNGWNYYRSGHAFVTTGAQSAIMTPIVVLGQYGVDVFEGETPLDQVGRRVVKKYQFKPEVWQINDALFRDYQYTAYDIAVAAKKKFCRCLVRYPRAFFLYFAHRMVRVVLTSFSFFKEYIHLMDIGMGHPFTTIQQMKGDFAALYMGLSRGSPTSALLHMIKKRGYFFTFVLVPLVILGCLVSLVLTLPTLVVFPIKVIRGLVRDKHLPFETVVMLLMWIPYVGMTGLFCLVQWEHRYTIGVAPVVLIISLLLLRKWAATIKSVSIRNKRPATT